MLIDSLVKQRMAAILAADVAGYSRLMAADGPATVASLDAGRAVFREHVATQGGQVIDMAGDSVLAVFDNASAAVRAATAVQQRLAQGLQAVPEPRRMRFRIGLHQGEVLEKADGTVYGDGVNIAARLESLAEVGGITVSAAVAEATRADAGVHFVDQGEQLVKNIPYPVHAFRWVTADGTTPFGALPHLVQPARHPSIAVLPFANQSNDPEQEYFADGISEDLITALSRQRWLTVIARNSSFAYKGRGQDVRELGKTLGARYVLDGSVRKSGGRVRISCHLVDTSNGNDIWSKRFDRDLAETFELQDEITLTIAGAIEPELSKAEQDRVRRKPVDNMDAWDLYQRGAWHFYRYNKEGHAEAQQLFQAALARDPQFAPALSFLAWCVYSSFVNRHDESADSFERARELALRALALDDKESLPRFVLGRIYSMSGKVRAGLEELLQAVHLNPSFALAHYGLGATYLRLDRWEEACECLATAERLSPHDASIWSFQSTRSLALSIGGHYEQAESLARKAAQHPAATFWALASLASVLGHRGKLDDGRGVVAELLAKRPDFSMALFRRVYSVGVSTSDEPSEGVAASTRHFFEGMNLAGLPRR